MAARSTTRLIRWPERKSATIVLIIVLLLSAIFWYFGADVWHSILLGAAIVTIIVASGVCLAVGTDPERRASEWQRGSHTNLRGSRYDVAYLSSSLSGGFGRVGQLAESRMGQLARRRLALHHLDLTNPDDRPEIERLVGRRAYRLFVRKRRRKMRLRSFLFCLDVLDRLDPMQYHSRRPSER